ncbi:uncharacterized protein LOC135372331 [Ornithodoros turicata]|uniref:uncharacterized protein LOC135372331 n=1 Tax=Ornithodoros turicata TaxID=34597 RepID=UPI003139F160
MRIAIKRILHLSLSYPNLHVHLPAREGGLGTLQLEWTAAACQLKALARLARLADPFVDAVLGEALQDQVCKLSAALDVPQVVRLVQKYDPAITVQREKVYTAIDGTRLKPDIVIAKGDNVTILDVAVAWDPNPAAFEVINTGKEAKIERHNYIAKQIIRLAKKYDPSIGVDQERVMTAVDGTRLKPDIVITKGEQVLILDVAVAWDASPAALEVVNQGKNGISGMVVFRSAWGDVPQYQENPSGARPYSRRFGYPDVAGYPAEHQVVRPPRSYSLNTSHGEQANP